ncbi:TOPRIM nucleotidyl transferase/hydrolase domain-containing protein [Nocardioides pantholopis]|uniref:TOPRIM nucleotidyl transferase/hydrolase domain-containing protein n=1 Tax=Nocardioides pantholopis TaxID=2483798 RepID=UPI000FDC05F5|nr:TOPRIM nucleotidyl transferase/hydrolase domain-containing protein [Nocardioides pantholopis]
MPRPITLLVEGESDRAALVTLAPRFGVDLDAEQITVTVIGGAGNFGRAIAEATAQGHRVGGLYDEAEERFVAGALNRQDGEDLTRQGFFACRPDLELELARAIGVPEMTSLLEANGDLKTFRDFQDQPAHRDHEALDQVRRFVSASGARKAKYAALMAETVPFESVPEPLEGLLGWIWSR